MNRFVLRRMTRLDALARDLEAHGSHHDAAELREELCELAREHLGEENPWLADRLLELASTYRQLGALDRAEATYRRSLELLDRRPQKTSSKLAQASNALGVLLCEQNRPEPAADLFRRALALSANPPQGNATVATVHNNLASALHSTGRLTDARNHYVEALRIFEKYPPSAAEAHCRCDLAELLAEQEEDESGQQITKALESFSQLYPPKSPRLAEAKVRIADLYFRTANHTLAKPLLEEAAEVFACSDPHHPSLTDCLDILSNIDLEDR